MLFRSEKIEVGAKRLIQKVDGQGGSKQKRQHLWDSPRAGTITTHHQQGRIEYQQGMDADGVQIDERPPRGDIQPAGAEQGQHCARDAERIKLLFAPIPVREGVI